MKYIKNNKIYVQLYDLNYIIYNGAGITPKSVFDKALKQAVNMNDDNKYDYIEFDDNHEINYFEGLSFIINKDEIDNMSIDELFDFYNYSKEALDHIGNLFKSVHRAMDLITLKSEYNKERHRFDTLKYLYNKRTKEKEMIKEKSLKPSTLNTANNNV